MDPKLEKTFGTLDLLSELTRKNNNFEDKIDQFECLKRAIWASPSLLEIFGWIFLVHFGQEFQSNFCVWDGFGPIVKPIISTVLLLALFCFVFCHLSTWSILSWHPQESWLFSPDLGDFWAFLGINNLNHDCILKLEWPYNFLYVCLLKSEGWCRILVSCGFHIWSRFVRQVRCWAGTSCPITGKLDSLAQSLSKLGKNLWRLWELVPVLNFDSGKKNSGILLHFQHKSQKQNQPPFLGFLDHVLDGFALKRAPLHKESRDSFFWTEIGKNLKANTFSNFSFQESWPQTIPQIQSSATQEARPFFKASSQSHLLTNTPIHCTWPWLQGQQDPQLWHLAWTAWTLLTWWT